MSRSLFRSSSLGFARGIAAMVPLAAVLLVGCDPSDGPAAPAALASITVTRNPVSLGIGVTEQFVAVGRDAAGNVVAITPVWSVVAGGGTINSTGLFTAGNTLGTFNGTVQATSGGLSGTASVTVVAGPLATIAVTPTPVTLASGAAQQFTATGYDAGGNVVAITPTWSVAAGGGTINGTGLFTAGGAAGTFANTVQAASGGISGTATVTVTVAGPPAPLATITVTPNPITLASGATQQFTATGRDAAGTVVAITPVWSVVAGGGAVNGTGLFTAGASAGTYANTVQATSGGISGTATVTVTNAGPPPVLATITVTPNPATLGTGATQQFTATGRTAAGLVVAITPVWSVVAGGGAVNATGLFTAGAFAGTYTNTVQATSGGISGNATVIVTSAGPPPIVATITVTPNPDTLGVGGSKQFVAVGKDGAGNVIAITPVWTVANGGGSITNTGLFTAGAVPGTFNNTVTATSGAVSGTATVVVTAAVPPPLIALGSTATFGILAGTQVTCNSGGIIAADVGVWPGGAVTTGAPPCTITGTQHKADAVAMQAQSDLTVAYNQLAALPCGTTIAADLGGTTVTPGVRCSASGIGVTGELILDGQGNSNATFVFQAGTSLTAAGFVTLINGAQSKNVFWQVGTSATVATTGAGFKGNILANASITLNAPAPILIGRALARNGAVTLGSNGSITLP